MQLRFEPVSDLREHARIPGSFEALTVIEVSGSFGLTERTLPSPYRKNYDDYEDPLAWPRDFDTTGWILVAAFVGDGRVGGAIVAASTPGVDMLEGRADLAVLWDLRVAPAHRRHGIANALVAAAQTWARGRGCTEMKVETQNTNPAACRFYMHNGFALSQVRRGVYPQLPADIQLIWRKRLDG